MRKLATLMIFLGTSAIAQPNSECQLLQQRLTASSGDAKLCLALYQHCIQRATGATDVPAAKNQCSADLGGCQMGGALEGEDRTQAIASYKKLCGKSN